MNKKLLFLCTIAVAGFVTLTAFGGKTLEQQKAEIAVMVQGKLDEFRAQKEVECTDRVNLEAQRRFDEYLAAQAAAKPTTGKKGSSKGPSAKPVPAPTKPTSTTPPSQGKWNDGQPTESKDKWNTNDPAKPTTTQESKSKWQKSGGK
jgi:hypothetical protein